ncbi:MAG: hypothetical protein ACOX6X_06580 [Dethiobacteria bacterium]|jgi:hypothetical protein
MNAEEKARQKIDNLPELAGWELQSLDQLNLGAALGVGDREPTRPLK